MALNDAANKQRARDELNQLITAYQTKGGNISRASRGRVSVICSRCGAMSWLSAAYAAQFKPPCTRCGAVTRIIG
jgi:hypothetical protein